MIQIIIPKISTSGKQWTVYINSYDVKKFDTQVEAVAFRSSFIDFQHIRNWFLYKHKPSCQY